MARRTPLHQYERTCVIRVRFTVYADGGIRGDMAVDSDFHDRDQLLGILQRALWHVGSGGDRQHERLEISGLPPFRRRRRQEA